LCVIGTVRFGAGDGVAVAEALARDVAALADACAELADACAELADARAELTEVRAEADDWPTVGVRVPVAPPGPLVCGVGVKTLGVTEVVPPPEQAVTATASSRAPAAERPAISHAPGAGTGRVRRIFMNPPRMRVR
jgi:hypothetical protein